MTSKQSESQFSLKDQEFLKELGISCMAPGLEFALRQKEEAAKAMKRIEARADGLQALTLDNEAIKALAREKGISPSQIESDMRHFRDIDPDDEGELIF